jgi:hypothetical protein
MQCDENRLWVIRGMVGKKDASIVVESPTQAEAEAIGWRRGIEVVVTGDATPEDVRIARECGLLYRYTAPPRLTMFGRAVGRREAACFMLIGIATILLDLRAWHVPVHF